MATNSLKMSQAGTVNRLKDLFEKGSVKSTKGPVVEQPPTRKRTSVIEAFKEEEEFSEPTKLFRDNSSLDRTVKEEVTVRLETVFDNDCIGRGVVEEVTRKLADAANSSSMSNSNSNNNSRGNLRSRSGSQVSKDAVVLPISVSKILEEAVVNSAPKLEEEAEAAAAVVVQQQQQQQTNSTNEHDAYHLGKRKYTINIIFIIHLSLLLGICMGYRQEKERIMEY